MGSQDIDTGDGRKITSGPDDGAEEPPTEGTAPPTALQIEPSFSRPLEEMKRIFGLRFEDRIGARTDDKMQRGRLPPTPPENSTRELIN